MDAVGGNTRRRGAGSGSAQAQGPREIAFIANAEGATINLVARVPADVLAKVKP